MGALSRLDELLLNPQATVHSGLVPKTSRYSNSENQRTNEDHSQNGSHPEVGASLSQSPQELVPEETSYMFIMPAFIVRFFQCHVLARAAFYQLVLVSTFLVLKCIDQSKIKIKLIHGNLKKLIKSILKFTLKLSVSVTGCLPIESNAK